MVKFPLPKPIKTMIFSNKRVSNGATTYGNESKLCFSSVIYNDKHYQRMMHITTPKLGINSLFEKKLTLKLDKV